MALGFAAIEWSWRSDLRRPSVILLGAGKSLSVLVTDGDARLLIAAGDDPTAFGNALGRVMRPSQDRLDLVIVDGSSRTLPAAIEAVGRPGVRAAAAIAPFPRSPDQPAMLALYPIGAPRRIDLGSVVVLLETVSSAEDANQDWSWRATIDRGPSRIVVLSDGEAAARFPPVHPGAVVVVAGAEPLAGWQVGPAPALVLADAAIPAARLREAAATDAAVPSYAVRVFPGEALPLTFVPGGVALPGEPVVTLRASEEPR